MFQVFCYKLICPNNKKSLSYTSYQMNMKTSLIEDYVKFVNTTTKQNTFFKIILVLFVLIVSLFFFCYLSS